MPVKLMPVLIGFLFFLLACNSPYSHKPRGYYNISFPEHSYQKFDKPGFPFQFEFPAYASIVQDSTYFDASPENPFWVNVDFPDYHARIFLSYKIIGGRSPLKVKNPDGTYRDSSGVNVLDKLINDAYNLTAKNQVVALSIRDSLFVNPFGVPGISFRVGGNAATARQFFATDSTTHFLRGALYIEVPPNADSLKPVNDFLGKDLDHLINTLQWKP